MSSRGTIRRRSSWTAALWTLVAVGVVLRVVRYAADRSLWGDEGALALNVVQRSPGELLEPLDYFQGAPTGFLLIEKVITSLLGESDLTFRLFPLLSGIASLVLLALIARRILRVEAAVLALALAAFAEPLVYYSSEVKQYETDVLAALLLLYAAVAVDWSRVRVLNGVAVATGGAVVVWLSHAALLVLPSLLAVLLVSARLRRDVAALRTLVALGVVWGGSALAAFAVNRKNTEAVAAAALETSHSPGQGALEPLRKAWDAYADVVGVANSTTALAVVAALAGLIALWRRNPSHAALVVAPGIATFLAAVAGRYPLSDRFILFLAPALILLAAEGAAALVTALPRALAPVGLAGAVLLLLYPLALSVGNAANPPGHEEVKALLRTMEQEWRPGDTLYVWWQSQYVFRYYAECNGCDVLGSRGPAQLVWPPDSSDLAESAALQTHEPDLYVPSRSDSDDLDTYTESVASLDGRKRAWFLFSSTWDDGFVQHVLDCMGRRLFEARAKRAVAYLYDLSATPAASCPG